MTATHKFTGSCGSIMPASNCAWAALTASAISWWESRRIALVFSDGCTDVYAFSLGSSPPTLKYVCSPSLRLLLSLALRCYSWGGSGAFHRIVASLVANPNEQRWWPSVQSRRGRQADSLPSVHMNSLPVDRILQVTSSSEPFLTFMEKSKAAKTFLRSLCMETSSCTSPVPLPISQSSVFKKAIP
jgi:hypothetical protein